MDATHPAMLDRAWAAYYDRKAELSPTGQPLGWNPRQVFAAGYQAAIDEVRASGWANGAAGE